MASIEYIPSTCGMIFHSSDKRYKYIYGPFGSGKTVICAEDILFYCMAQEPNKEGIRNSRWGIVRATYGELVSTTIPTFRSVFPDTCGTINSAGSPIKGHYRWKLQDGTTVNIELVFRALDSLDDENKIRSSDWTGVFINEGTTISSDLFEAISGRIGRFPSGPFGDCSYAPFIIDSNMPPLGSFLDTLVKAEANNPASKWLIVKQPPAAFKRVDDSGRVSYEVNKEAENLCNLGPKIIDPEYPGHRGVIYYEDQIDMYMRNRSYEKIDSLFCMLDVPITRGKKVFPDFSVDKHVGQVEPDVMHHQPVVIGYDTSGIHPACIIIQEQYGKWVVMDELYGDEMGFDTFMDSMLVPLLITKYARCNIVFCVDPADARNSKTGSTPSNDLKDRGYVAKPAYTNAIKQRIRAVENMLNMDRGGILISPKCTDLISAMSGKYHYKKLRTSGTIDEVYSTMPDKNAPYSHLADALQYACLYVTKGSGIGSDNRQHISTGKLSRKRAIFQNKRL